MINIPTFKEYEMSLNTVDKLVTYLDSLDLPNVSSDTYLSGDNTYQTPNILNINDNIDKIIDNIITNINNDLGLISKPYHVHYIKYGDSGSLGWHRHSHNEELSILLYLTDAVDGETIISLNDERDITLIVKPKKGKMILFNSTCNHVGLESKNKNVFVIGLRLPEVIQV